MQIPQIRKDYKPIAFKLKMEGRTQVGLYRKAVSEGNMWGYEKFKQVCTGWSRHEDIEAWLDKEGLGDELRKAQKATGILTKQAKAEAVNGN